MGFNIRKQNILQPDKWQTGSGSTTGFDQNGATVENERVFATNPFGQTSVVWETRTNGLNDAEGGWNTSYFNIDRTKMYRFSVWMRRTSSTSSGTFYFGLYGFNGSVNNIGKNDGSGNEANPYWDCSAVSQFTQNTWYLVVGHVFPFDTVYTGRHPETGIYTIAGGTTKVFNVNGCNIGTGDVKWLSDQTQALHRTYHFYSTDSTVRLQFFDPRVEVCDGTEVSLAELLTSNSPTIDSTTISYEGAGQKHNYGDGSTISNPAQSGYHLKMMYPSKASGFYWIQSPKMPVPQYMYVDMTEEGGGYDFYFVTTGPSVTGVTQTNGGTTLGLDLVMPRSKFHWRAMVNAVNGQRPTGSNVNDYFQTCYGVYSPTSNVNDTTKLMRSAWYNPSGAPATSTTNYRVGDGGRWWLRDNTYTQPSGDYTANGLLGLVAAGNTIANPYLLDDIQFNDQTANYSTGNYYLVSTNLKP
jgi:hypothetical protein